MTNPTVAMNGAARILPAALAVLWVAYGAYAFGLYRGYYHQPIPRPPAVAALPADGLYTVTEVRSVTPGTYTTRPAGTCEWERLAGPTPHHDVIESGRETGDRPVWVRVDRTDTAFWSAGCEPWERVGR